MARNRSIYMGPNSTAKLPSIGQVNTDWEVLMNVYGTAYDSIDNVMLTRDPKKLDAATINELKGRFFILKSLAKKHSPQKLDTIKKIEQIAYQNARGSISDDTAHKKIRFIIHQQKMSNALLDNVERKIDAAQGRAQGNMFNFGNINNNKNNTHPLAQFMKDQQKLTHRKSQNKKRGPTQPLFASPTKKHKPLLQFFEPPKQKKEPKRRR